MRIAPVLIVMGCSASKMHSTVDGPGSGASDGATGDATAQVSVVDVGTEVQISNGSVTIVIDKSAGTWSSGCRGTTAITGAYASVDAGGTLGYLKSIGYASHTFTASDVVPVHDAFGDGVRVPIVHAMAGRPTITQTFTLYPAHPDYFLLDEVVTNNSAMASNYLGALIVDPSTGWVAPPAGSDARFLDAPYDNDEWVRWDSRALGTADLSGTSYEVGALYEASSRAGLVVGSVTHDFWKTGIYYNYDASQHRMRSFNVWGGVATHDAASLTSGATYGGDGTHDFAAHGKQTGTTLTSPRIFVGCSTDWRDGLEQFGHANALVSPPRTWTGGAPFGWMSWGAYGAPVTASQVMAASDFIAALPNFTSTGGVYIDIDAGFHGDTACATAACVAQHIHANGQRAGTYRTPFSYWGTDLAATVGGTSYTYNDVVLHDDSGNPIRRHGAYILDVTHPGSKQLIQSAMASVVTDGFDLVKLDFLSDGAMEGRHYDTSVGSGIAAYNAAMKDITSQLPPSVFISESIAPMFPGHYAHARRISTDVIGQLVDEQCPTWPHYGSTEYMLNALTFSWWLQGNVYAFNDPDGIALGAFKPNNTSMFPEPWPQTHVTASAIAGTMFFDTTDLSNATGASRARTYLTNVQVNGVVAAAGRAFRPLDGNVGYVSASDCDGRPDTNAGSRAATVFERHEPDGSVLVVAFDYGAGSTVSVDLSRLGLSATTTYPTTDLWSGAKDTANGTLSITLGAGEARLLRLSPP